MTNFKDKAREEKLQGLPQCREEPTKKGIKIINKQIYDMIRDIKLLQIKMQAQDDMFKKYEEKKYRHVWQGKRQVLLGLKSETKLR